jgi:hypothetical protein
LTTSCRLAEALHGHGVSIGDGIVAGGGVAAAGAKAFAFGLIEGQVLGGRYFGFRDAGAHLIEGQRKAGHLFGDSKRGGMIVVRGVLAAGAAQEKLRTFFRLELRELERAGEGACGVQTGGDQHVAGAGRRNEWSDLFQVFDVVEHQ